MILLVFATFAEAKGTVQALKAVEIKPSVYYAWHQGRIVISGMGCIAAATAVAIYGKKARKVINIGIAGALNPHLILGKTYPVSMVAKHTPLPDGTSLPTFDLVSGIFPFHHLPHKTSGLRLISSDYPIHDPTSKQALSSYDLVDMEGYGFFTACRALNKACDLYKKVSDFTNPQGPQLIKSCLDEFSNEIGKEIVDLILRDG